MFPVSNNKASSHSCNIRIHIHSEATRKGKKRGGEKNIFGKQKRQFQGDKTWHYGNACFKLQGSIKIKMKKQKQKKNVEVDYCKHNTVFFFFLIQLFPPKRGLWMCFVCRLKLPWVEGTEARSWCFHHIKPGPYTLHWIRQVTTHEVCIQLCKNVKVIAQSLFPKLQFTLYRGASHNSIMILIKNILVRSKLKVVKWTQTWSVVLRKPAL